MAKKEAKQNFLGGAAILAAAVAIVKLIGAIFKIPLTNIIGAEGMTHFNTAYKIYNLLLTVSTAGLPLALSRLVSEANALGRENEKRRIFRVALGLFFLLGLAGSLIMFFGTGPLSELMNNTLAFAAIRALSPAVICVCLMSAMRGYTQGQGNMTPTAISQIIEALCKLVVGLTLAVVLLRQGFSVEIGAAGGIFGVTVGTAASLLFLSFYLLLHRSTTPGADLAPSSGHLLKRLLVIGVPITLGSSGMSLISLIDQSVAMGRLQDGLHMTEKAAAALYGQYTFSENLFNLPSSFVYPVTMSLIPAVAAALAQQNHSRVTRLVNSSFRLIATLVIPAGVGLSVLAGPILLMLYPSQREDAVAATYHLQLLGIACIFVCLMVLTNAILQSHGRERIPIFTIIAGGLVKIAMNYVLIGNPDINIKGAPISTLCCYVVIAGLNLFFVYRTLEEKPSYWHLFFKPALASVLMGLCARMGYLVCADVLSARMGDYSANALATLVGIGAGVVVYVILVPVFRILTAEDLKNIRGGEKISKILHLK